VCADEKTSIQARARIHDGSPPAPGRARRVEHEYERRGALAYLAAWDVHRAQVFGRCESSTGIAPFGRLVDEVMSEEPYASARRVFWVVDNGSSHRGPRTEGRLRERWPSIRVVHTPIHASWLNQVELYFSVVQRKVLEPNEWRSLAALETALLAFAIASGPAAAESASGKRLLARYFPRWLRRLEIIRRETWESAY
jgi:hypothetical protein